MNNIDWFYPIFTLRLAGIAILFTFFGHVSSQLNTRAKRVVMWILSILSFPYLWIVQSDSILENFGSASNWLNIVLAFLIAFAFFIGTRMKNLNAGKFVKKAFYFVVFYSCFEFAIIILRTFSSIRWLQMTKDSITGIFGVIATLILWLLIWLIMKIVHKGSRELALVIAIAIVVISFSGSGTGLPSVAVDVTSIICGIWLAKQKNLFPDLQKPVLGKVILFIIIYNLFYGFMWSLMQVNKQSYNPILGEFEFYKVPNLAELIIFVPLLNLLYGSLAGHLILPKSKFCGQQTSSSAP